MTPDYQRIAELEYELGFSDEPPPPKPSRAQNTRCADAILKEMFAVTGAAEATMGAAPADVVETMHRPGRGGYGGRPVEVDPIFSALVEGDWDRRVQER